MDNEVSSAPNTTTTTTTPLTTLTTPLTSSLYHSRLLGLGGLRYGLGPYGLNGLGLGRLGPYGHLGLGGYGVNPLLGYNPYLLPRTTLPLRTTATTTKTEETTE